MLRRVSDFPKSVFLTFDDGPDPVGTPQVLETLRRHSAKATFFVIADCARRHRDILRDILREGHSVGNHSLDHAYRNYWRGVPALKEWVTSADSILRAEGVEPVGFRPPAGVMTPNLRIALRELGQPVVMWNERFLRCRSSLDGASRAEVGPSTCRRISCFAP